MNRRFRGCELLFPIGQAVTCFDRYNKLLYHNYEAILYSQPQMIQPVTSSRTHQQKRSRCTIFSDGESFSTHMDDRCSLYLMSNFADHDYRKPLFFPSSSWSMLYDIIQNAPILNKSYPFHCIKDIIQHEMVALSANKNKVDQCTHKEELGLIQFEVPSVGIYAAALCLKFVTKFNETVYHGYG